ncbi:MAG: radical SAM protein [Thermodesulfovibrionales bacterium]|nr:radical SAM protein [Thermodesulfovibrionales bacterium]
MPRPGRGNKNPLRCLLLIPSWVPEEIFSSKTSQSQINYWQPLGTLYVASSLIQAGHEVNFLNGAFMSHEEIMAHVKSYKPEFAGIYSTTFGWKKALKTAKDIKDADKDIFICTGGPYPIAMKDACLVDNIDAVVTGEGELTVVEMLERLQAGKGLEGVQGVIYKDSGKAVVNPPRPLIADLDSIPFPKRELLGDSSLYIPPPATYRRKPVAVMITSRGCNRQCIFCFQIDKERKSGVRYRSVGNVMEEIELCLRQGYREIKFLDDTFAADYKRAMEIAHEIKARRLDFTWFASACVNQVDKPLLRAFKDAGCWAVLFGAESGVQKNLNSIKKGTTIEQIKKAVQAAKDAGLKVSTPFMFGIPGETFEEGLQTIEFAIKLNPDMANFHAITPFPGSYLYDNLQKYGTMSEELTDFTYQGAAFVPYSMTKEQIFELRRLAFKKFYSRPSFILKKMMEMRSLNDIKTAAKSLRSLFYLWKGYRPHKEKGN